MSITYMAAANRPDLVAPSLDKENKISCRYYYCAISCARLTLKFIVSNILLLQTLAYIYENNSTI